MEFVCKNKWLRHKHHRSFTDLQDAQEMEFIQWEELAKVLPEICGKPEGSHSQCRNTKVCALCKVKEDDRNYNPSRWKLSHGSLSPKE